MTDNQTKVIRRYSFVDLKTKLYFGKIIATKRFIVNRSEKCSAVKSAKLRKVANA